MISTGLPDPLESCLVLPKMARGCLFSVQSELGQSNRGSRTDSCGLRLCSSRRSAPHTRAQEIHREVQKSSNRMAVLVYLSI